MSEDNEQEDGLATAVAMWLRKSSGWATVAAAVFLGNSVFKSMDYLRDMLSAVNSLNQNMIVLIEKIKTTPARDDEEVFNRGKCARAHRVRSGGNL